MDRTNTSQKQRLTFNNRLKVLLKIELKFLCSKQDKAVLRKSYAGWDFSCVKQKISMDLI